jgi:hypothetical protein
MKTYYKNICVGLASLLVLWGCTRKMDDFRAFLGNQEIAYPGKIVSPEVLPGNLRLELAWTPSPDPSVTKYVVYWNNNQDSVVLSAKTHSTQDTVKCVIPNLSEYTYTFFVYSYDSVGNRSVPTEIDNAQVYGTVYRTNLHNRTPDVSNPALLNSDGTINLNLLLPVDTINITTEIKYVNMAGDSVFVNLAPDQKTYTMPTYKVGTKITYQSSYIPKQGAIDTFFTTASDTIPVYVMCDKSLFNEVHLPNDMGQLESDTYEARLWDGNMQPRDYPNLFHSDGNGTFPRTLTFDMGAVYNQVGRLEETGRTCCHNPVDFEVWGIADTTGAISTLQSNDPGWKSDVTAKGWALLTEVVRNDNGNNPVDVYLQKNPPPVRFIIMRIIKTADDPNYVNFSQVTFWNKQ